MELVTAGHKTKAAAQTFHVKENGSTIATIDVMPNGSAILYRDGDFVACASKATAIASLQPVGLLTPSQIKWAASHDWFYADKGNGTIVVKDRYSQQHPDGSITHHEDTLVWNRPFGELRNWAGY